MLRYVSTKACKNWWKDARKDLIHLSFSEQVIGHLQLRIQDAIEGATCLGQGDINLLFDLLQSVLHQSKLYDVSNQHCDSTAFIGRENHS